MRRARSPVPPKMTKSKVSTGMTRATIVGSVSFVSANAAYLTDRPSKSSVCLQETKEFIPATTNRAALAAYVSRVFHPTKARVCETSTELMLSKAGLWHDLGY